MADAANAKQYYQTYLKRKNKKRSKIITQQSKTLENPNIVGIKSVTKEHPKTSHKAGWKGFLSKFLQSTNSSLRGKTEKVKNFWMQNSKTILCL